MVVQYLYPSICTVNGIVYGLPHLPCLVPSPLSPPPSHLCLSLTFYPLAILIRGGQIQSSLGMAVWDGGIGSMAEQQTAHLHPTGREGGREGGRTMEVD